MGIDIKSTSGHCFCCKTEFDELYFGICEDCMRETAIFNNSGIMENAKHDLFWIPAHVKELQKMADTYYNKKDEDRIP